MNAREGRRGLFYSGASWVLGGVDTAVRLAELREATHTFSLKMFQPPIHSLYSGTPHIGFSTITDQPRLSAPNYDGNDGSTPHPSRVFPIVMPLCEPLNTLGMVFAGGGEGGGCLRLSRFW